MSEDDAAKQIQGLYKINASKKEVWPPHITCGPGRGQSIAGKLCYKQV